jgi:F0F1-type ATP synthase delta subunit
MNFGIIFLLFALQIVVALIVSLVLKKLLDRELIESALEQFEVLKYQGDSALIKTISVVGHKDLAAELQTRFKSVAARRFKGVAVSFSADRELKGGVKITLNDAVIDCTLRDRLQKLFAGR